jgi:hypothetical protein
MKNILITGFCIIALMLLFNLPAAMSYQAYDDFSDGNDTANPAWTHLSGYVASSGQTWDASSFNYRMTAPNNGASALGFVGSYTGPILTDSITTADLLNWVPNPGGVFGVGARLNGNNAVAQLTGYAYFYEPFSAGGVGEFVLARINPGVAVNDIGADGAENVDYVRQFTLDTNKDYRMSLSVQGTTLYGEVREILGGDPDDDPIVAYQTRSNIDMIPGPPDPPGPYYASGYSGFVAYSQNPLPPTDVTWDNFNVIIPEQSTAALFALGAALMCFRRRR